MPPVRASAVRATASELPKIRKYQRQRIVRTGSVEGKEIPDIEPILRGYAALPAALYLCLFRRFTAMEPDEGDCHMRRDLATIEF